MDAAPFSSLRLLNTARVFGFVLFAVTLAFLALLLLFYV
jgi:hypothetical protein